MFFLNQSDYTVRYVASIFIVVLYNMHGDSTCFLENIFFFSEKIIK